MANNDGKIYITISDRRFGGNKAEADEQNNLDKQKEKKNPLSDFAKHKFFNFIEAQTKQVVNYSINNIGNFTGDYVSQQQTQDAVAILSGLMDIGAAAFAGFKYSGSPYGALIGAGIAIAGKAISRGQQLAVGYSQNELQNRQIAQLRTRAGLNSSNNGSRGTEY